MTQASDDTSESAAMRAQQASQGGSHAGPTPPDSSSPFRPWTVSPVWMAVLGAVLLEGAALGWLGEATPCLVIPIAAVVCCATLFDRSCKVSMDVRTALRWSFLASVPLTAGAVLETVARQLVLAIRQAVLLPGESFLEHAATNLQSAITNSATVGLVAFSTTFTLHACVLLGGKFGTTGFQWLVRFGVWVATFMVVVSLAAHAAYRPGVPLAIVLTSCVWLFGVVGVVFAVFRQVEASVSCIRGGMVTMFLAHLLARTVSHAPPHLYDPDFFRVDPWILLSLALLSGSVLLAVLRALPSIVGPLPQPKAA